MTWNKLTPEIRELAEATLTEKQLAAWKLELSGLGARYVAMHLHVSRSTAKEHLAAAHRNLYTAGVRQDGSGHWHLEEAA